MGLLLTTALAFSAVAPSALAANVNGNTAFVNEGNLDEQTIVGEGQNNNVVITNTAETQLDPTGIFMANAPLFIIGAFVIAGTVVAFAKVGRE